MPTHMNKLEKSLSLIERMNFLGKQHLLTESQESSSQKEAIRYVEQHFGWPHEKANNFVRIDLRNDITSLRDKKIGKFTLGVTRMFCNGELRDANIISNLNATLKLLSAHLNEYDRNLNGLSASELIQRFSKHRQDNLEAEKEDIDAMDFSNGSNYNIVPINSFEEANQYYKYTNPNSRWCLTHMEDMFDSYTCGGINQIYFCLQNGFENIPPKVGEGTPLDEYGLSMLSIIVNEKGELAYCTTRWNHDNGGTDSSMSTKEISQVVGVNFYNTFKPNNKWKDLLAQVEQRLANGEDPRDVFDWVNSFNDGFAVVRLNEKHNYINTEGKFISSQWFDTAWNFSNGLGVVELNGKYNLINTEGKLISSQWFNFWDVVELNGKFYKLDTSGRLRNVNENKQYKTNSNMKQKIVLKESDLHRVIKESVKQVMNENNQYDRGYKIGTRLAQTRIQRYGEQDGSLEIEKLINDDETLMDKHIEYNGTADSFLKGRLDGLVDFYTNIMNKKIGNYNSKIDNRNK